MNEVKDYVSTVADCPVTDQDFFFLTFFVPHSYATLIGMQFT